MNSLLWIAIAFLCTAAMLIVFAALFRAARTDHVYGSYVLKNIGEIKVCGRCGARLYDNETVCRSCGEKYTPKSEKQNNEKEDGRDDE